MIVGRIEAIIRELNSIIAEEAEVQYDAWLNDPSEPCDYSLIDALLEAKNTLEKAI